MKVKENQPKNGRRNRPGEDTHITRTQNLVEKKRERKNKDEKKKKKRARRKERTSSREPRQLDKICQRIR